MKFFPINTDFTNDFYIVGKYKLAFRLCLFFILVFGTLSVIFFPINQTAFYIYLSVMLLSLTGFTLLLKTKKFKVVFWMFTVAGSAIIAYTLNTILDTLHYSDMLWAVAIILFAFVGLGYKVALFFVGYHILVFSYYILFSINEHLYLVTQRDSMQLVGTLIEVLFALLVIAYLIHQNLRYQQYTEVELKNLNSSLELKNRENVTLLKEVHHRVKNNLQIVVSLLRMQEDEIETDETKEKFQESVNRIMTISLIHSKLYQSNELSGMVFSEYIEGLVRELIALHNSTRKSKIDFHANDVEVSLKSIVPVGLIINELITNSFKHAQTNDDPLIINFEFKKHDQDIQMTYHDNGLWSEGQQQVGFGSKLIHLLADQLDGKIDREGSKYCLTFHK